MPRSEEGRNFVNFWELERRMLATIRERVRRGELTERGLARLTGVSQPHIHNVLKGKRDLSRDTADAILSALGMDLLDLLDPQRPSHPPPRQRG
jgi:transcriptional regulator with XRE-family HTH domain